MSSSFSSSNLFSSSGFSSSGFSSSNSSTGLISNGTRIIPPVKIGDQTLLDGNAFGSALALFLFQILFIVTLSRLIYWPLKKIKQPAVIAEMLAGILLGPSALGRIPGFATIMFPASSLNIIRVCSSFGLVVFMFLVGMEMDAEEFKEHFTQVTIISGTGVIVPILLVAPVALLFDSDEFSRTTTFNLILFLGVAMGMSALPVLARILAERNMLSSPIGNLIMGATAIDDVMAWCLLSIVVAIVRSSQQLNILYVILLAIANMICVYCFIRPLLAYLCRHVHSLGDVKPHTFFVIFAVLLTVSWFTEAIGLSALVGAFEVGLMMPRNPALLTSISNKLEDIIVIIIMPLFFTNSGLRTNFFLLTDGRAWGLCVLLIVVAMFVKIISIFIPAKLFGLSIRDSLAFGILMSCKGLVALIVVNFGLDYQVITNKLFALLVIMVLITSLLTVPLTELVLPLRLFKNNTKRYKLQEETVGDGLNDGKHVELVNDSGTGTGLKPRLPVSSSDDNLILRYSHLFGQPLEMNDTTIKHLVMVVSNVQKSPGLVSIAAALSHHNKKNIHQHHQDHTHSHDDKNNHSEKDTRVLAYRPLLNDDYPSAYIRPSLQSLLIRDEAIQLITERATVHEIHNMGLVAMPVSSDDVIGQLSMLLMASNSEYLLINHTFLQDIDQSTASFIPTPSNPIYRLITTISHTSATIITLIDPIPSITASPASSQRHLLSNVSRSIHFHVHRIVVPIFPGIHCTRAIAIAIQLEKNGIEIIWIELISQHGQILPQHAHIITYDQIRSTSTSTSAATSPEQHTLHVHEENEATVASPSSLDHSSFSGFSDPTIQNTLLSSLSSLTSSDHSNGSISCILIGDDDQTGSTIPSVGSSSARNPSGSWNTSVDSTMTTWLTKVSDYAPILIVRASNNNHHNNNNNHSDPTDVTISPPTINSLTVVALQAGSR